MAENIYWIAWLGFPAIVMLLATIGRRRKQIFIGAIISLLGTVCFLVLAVSRMWELRLARAVTPEQIELASSDGANLVFTSVFAAPISGLIATAVWGAVGYWLAGRFKTKP